ncbi:MAG: NADPH-dependent F420 reductase [Anaerolineae bacterium]|nr:MAG: NADPH-dependent F420 reductase [Anaerolineae bacterium]
MNDKPTLAILGGTGKEGPGLALRWANAGYKVLIGSREAAKAEATAAELNTQLGIDTVEGLENAEAASRADISVLTVVQSAHAAALESVKDALQGKILVDATARVEFTDPRPPEPPSAARLAQNILGSGVRVVAAFQNVPANTLKKNLDQPVKTDVLVCADDVDAAEQVVALAEAGGMTAYFAGGLDNAVVVEGITALLIAMNKHYRGHGTVQITGVQKP